MYVEIINSHFNLLSRFVLMGHIAKHKYDHFLQLSDKINYVQKQSHKL